MAATVSVVKPQCFQFNPLTVDFDGLCWKWWDKAYRYSSSSMIKGCVELIKKKCPNMIRFETVMKKEFDEKSRYSELWKSAARVILKSNEAMYVKYYENDRKQVCTEEGGEDCDYWWTVAQREKAVNAVKEYCINRILKHCRNTITKKSETSAGKVQPWRTMYEIKTIVYERPGEYTSTATYNRYVPLKN